MLRMVKGGTCEQRISSPAEVAVGAARWLGLNVGRAVLLAERSNAIVALEPYEIVARVAMDVRLAARTAPAAREAYVREVAVAGRLAALGAPVLPPSDLVPPGPHEWGGRLVSFWPRLRDARAAEPTAAGRALRECRAALDEVCSLPSLWLFDEAAELTRHPSVMKILGPRADDVREQLQRERQTLAMAPLVSVHGDAGLGNAVEVNGAILWLDWEDAMAAPVLWDAACLAATSLVFGEHDAARAALTGLGVDPADPDLARLIRARVLQIVPWSALLVARGGTTSRDRLDQRLAWLDAH
jgi:phosphotransferase family enzyme